MKLLFLISCLLLPISVLAQNFDGSVKWTYSQLRIGPPVDPEFNVIEKSKDTIVDSRNAVVLEGIRIIRNDTEKRIDTLGVRFRWVMAYEGDRVYNYSFVRDSFYTLHDFSLGSGDTLRTLCYDDVAEYLVDSVATEMDGGVIRKIQYLSQELNNLNCGFSGKIIEGIGASDWMVPQSVLADPPHGGSLICFQQNDRTYPESAKCEIVASRNVILDEQHKLFPNPSTGLIHLSGTPLLIEDVKIYTVDGRVVLEENLSNGTVDASGLSEGIYFIYYRRGASQYYQKFFKSN